MFANEPALDFARSVNRERMNGALQELEETLRGGPFSVFPLIDGKAQNSADVYLRPDPSQPEVAIAKVHEATAEQVAQALKLAKQSFAPWERTGAQRRAACMQKAADLMREERFTLAALIVREAGKPWKEADGDVTEAIDFCRYYAEGMLRLNQEINTGSPSGEENRYFYQPRGVAAVISPWNFPLAITCGMTVAALVTGNTVLLKPSRQTSLIAERLCKILLGAGVPGSALAFLPGSGARISRQLVESPLVNLYCFTGSREVGLEIVEKAARHQAGQSHIKRVVAELGGKNAVIVDEDADLDEAIKGILISSFGYSGQKCSACSRVIAVGSAYEPLLERLCKAAADLEIGQAKESSTSVGPVIDEPSQKRILRVIEQARKNCLVGYEGKPPGNGYFVPPVIFRDVPRDHSIWREEIFGPVLSCARAETFSQALDLANDCDYALTGGLFSRSPSSIERARREFKVGNLYINRACTGALVGRQPFGGFRMSGVGSKAGGPDYLLQFLEPRCVTENTMRRGFVPES